MPKQVVVEMSRLEMCELAMGLDYVAEQIAGNAGQEIKQAAHDFHLRTIRKGLWRIGVRLDARLAGQIASVIFAMKRTGLVHANPAGVRILFLAARLSLATEARRGKRPKHSDAKIAKQVAELRRGKPTILTKQRGACAVSLAADEFSLDESNIKRAIRRHEANQRRLGPATRALISE